MVEDEQTKAPAPEQGEKATDEQKTPLTPEEELRMQVAELTTLVKSRQAELENYRKRMEREVAEYKEHANDRLVRDFVDVLDNFSLALKHGVDEKGVRMIYGLFMDKLKSHGVEERSFAGKPFDANFCQPLTTRHDPKQKEGVVLEEIAKAYFVNGKVVRPARVIVNKRAEQEEKEQAKNNDEQKSDHKHDNKK